MNLRVAFRSLLRSPGFTAMAVLTLTLGIGAVSAIFSVVNAVLLKPLAGFETERLVRASEKFPLFTSGFVRARTYHEWQKRTDIFDELGAWQVSNPTLTGLGEPQQLAGAPVTASWFRLYRTPPLLGRTFLPDEDQPGHAQVAVLDYGFWLRRFGGDAAVVGRQITLDQHPCVIVGVMPKGFTPLGKGQGDIYIPWIVDADELTAFEVTARLRPGVSIERVRNMLAVIEARLSQSAPDDYKGLTIEVEPLREAIVGQNRELLRLLLAAAGLVLLVACVNAANLFLARSTAKHHESQIRAFLGANARQLLTPALLESGIVSLIGGGLGLFVAWAGSRILAARLDNFPRAEEIGVDTRVAAMTFLVTVLTVLSCGLAPLIFRRRVASRVLIVTEVALTLVLLICSGLLIRSFAAMRQVDLGYSPSGVILGFIQEPEDPHNQRDTALALWRRVRQRIAALPDVATVATSTGTPTGGLNAGHQVVLEGEDPSRLGPDRASANLVIATGEYFKVVGIPLQAGRTFDEHDSVQALPVVIVSRSIADRYFGGTAVGKRLQLPSLNFNVTSEGPPALREIVGVVGDVKQRSVQEAGRMTLYLPEGQNAVRYTTIVARVRNGDPMRLEQSIRHALYEEAPTLAMAPMLSLDSAGAYLTRAPLRAMWLLSVFAGLALLMASVGVHGVVAYATTRRAREMGIRMALGARPGQLFALVTRQAMTMAMAGAAIGLAGAYAATRLLQSLLFGVGRTDPYTYGSAVLILVIVAAASSFTSALRAARTDPSITLRSE